MPIQIKIFFTIATLVVGLLIVIANPNTNNAAPDWIWRFEKNDLFRNWFFDTSGSLKTSMKIVLLFICFTFLFIIWMLVPTEFS
ncbi:hypothetical protein [Candidatus Electrothrix sp.]|uniref:hypothetical protein n=1 Tax=Candidatus Electrothrix sp. TaxID=2170559 RepID=UPI004056A169